MRSVSQIKEAIRQQDDRMYCSEMADNFYYTSGRRAKDLEIRRRLEEELKTAQEA